MIQFYLQTKQNDQKQFFYASHTSESQISESINTNCAKLLLLYRNIIFNKLMILKVTLAWYRFSMPEELKFEGIRF